MPLVRVSYKTFKLTTEIPFHPNTGTFTSFQLTSTTSPTNKCSKQLYLSRNLCMNKTWELSTQFSNSNKTPRIDIAQQIGSYRGEYFGSHSRTIAFSFLHKTDFYHPVGRFFSLHIGTDLSISDSLSVFASSDSSVYPRNGLPKLSHALKYLICTSVRLNHPSIYFQQYAQPLQVQLVSSASSWGKNTRNLIRGLFI